MLGFGKGAVAVQQGVHTAASAAWAATMVVSAPSDEVSRRASRMLPVSTPVAVNAAVNMTCCILPRNCAAPTPVAAEAQQPCSGTGILNHSGCALPCIPHPAQHGPQGSERAGFAAQRAPWVSSCGARRQPMPSLRGSRQA